MHEAVPDKTKKLFDLSYNFAENVLNWNKNDCFHSVGVCCM